jgi:hypothetical protein
MNQALDNSLFGMEAVETEVKAREEVDNRVSTERPDKKARLNAKLVVTPLDTCCNMACRKPISNPHLCAHCLNKEDAIYCSSACRASDANQHKALCMLHVNYSA